MEKWFTIKEIDSQTFAISEYGHWEKVHSYLFIGQESAALIDSGTGIGDISRVVSSLTHLPLIVMTTHCHWDHIGGHGHFQKIAIHADDRDWLENGLPIPIEMIRHHLVKEPFILDAPEEFSAETYVPYTGKPTFVLNDLDQFNLGQRVLHILHTPGHSPGHICIYEEDSGYLVTGDLLYEGTLYANYPSTDPVKFDQSIERLTTLPRVTKLLPGHNNLNIPITHLTDTQKAFQQIKSRNQLKHGTGLHTFGSISILL